MGSIFSCPLSDLDLAIRENRIVVELNPEQCNFEYTIVDKSQKEIRKLAPGEINIDQAFAIHLQNLSYRNNEVRGELLLPSRNNQCSPEALNLQGRSDPSKEGLISGAGVAGDFNFANMSIKRKVG